MLQRVGHNWATEHTCDFSNGPKVRVLSTWGLSYVHMCVQLLSLWPCGLEHARPPCPSLLPWICSNSCPLSWWYHPAISLSPPSPPALNLSQHQGLFPWVNSSYQVAKVLELQLQHQSSQWVSQPHHGEGACVTQWSYEPCYAGPTKMDRS